MSLHGIGKMPAEAMSEMQRQLHSTSVCLVRCGMRAHKGLLRKHAGTQQARLSACAIACCLRRQYRCQIYPWEKKRWAELKNELHFVTIFSVVARNLVFT